MVQNPYWKLRPGRSAANSDYIYMLGKSKLRVIQSFSCVGKPHAPKIVGCNKTVSSVMWIHSSSSTQYSRAFRLRNQPSGRCRTVHNSSAKAFCLFVGAHFEIHIIKERMNSIHSLKMNRGCSLEVCLP